MKSPRDKLLALLDALPRRGDPFPVGGLSALADKAGMSRQAAHQIVWKERPEIAERHKLAGRTTQRKNRRLCGRCGAKA